ncbi:SLC13 family permease [Desulfallas thermosapovorans]|uniref:Sodium-dependent dicarboxylate transporter SdcS n=1 Tax=Desulfallas thermosapovorans DSM 6562 TaxID=1121431 RepID=A0A5S4ZY57_9FIRM|nr:DASS family sodium-coupled anion symporter [Desulfallas thermosapovorans]TYO97952.1 sodium-dependent dicarboxylate transporter 2/3/5 [Desulfallas thermosapovorans DSM 6562]
MSSLISGLENLWQYMWQLSRQTKRLIRFDMAAMADNGNLSEKERKIAEQVLPGGTDSLGRGNSGGGSDNGSRGGGYNLAQKIGLILGPVLFLLVLIMPTPADMPPVAKLVLAAVVWIAIWWITEAIPIPATSLLPIVLFPLLGVQDVKSTTASYGDSTVFLFMGGFFIAAAMERWNLHRRIALNIIKLVGTGPKTIILGFMVATAFLSMWISNTATAMMMMPIGLAVIVQVALLLKQQGSDIDTSLGRFNFGTALMLGIAYAASIGGVATIIGTPPNGIFVGVAKEMWGQDISFASWLAYGIPLAAVTLIFAWWYLTTVAYPVRIKELPGGMKVINDEIKKLGPISRAETQVASVFILVALLWISSSFVLKDFIPMINDATISILGAVLLFLLPVNLAKGQFILDWESALKIPWGILLLFGGGISLAGGFKSSGLAEWIATRLTGLEGASMLVIVLAVTTMAIFLTEVTSNTATATMLMPVMASMGIAMGIHPYALMITAAIACSYAFMLPVATPPNAVVFGTGYVTIPQMARAGFALNIFGVIAITALTLYYLPVVWGISFNTIPAWIK